MNNDGFKTHYREAVLDEQGRVIGYRGWINPPLPLPEKVNLNADWMKAMETEPSPPPPPKK